MSIAPLVTVAEIRRSVSDAKKSGRKVGFVPTMGALHAGHGALIRCAREECSFVVVSVFVNPIQFDRQDDFELYPRTLARDLAFCDTHGAHAVFAPPAREMYPSEQLTYVDVAKVSERLCGEFRPGHFRGVATVVTKLLNVVQPDCAYFGEKDAQQLAVIQRMAADLNLPVSIVPVPTVREPDGLAMSSRNARLSAEERAIAPAVYRALLEAQAAFRLGATPADALQTARGALEAEPRIRVEYLEFVDPATMQPAGQGGGPLRIMAAAWLRNVRLIDNVLCHPPA